MKEKICPAIAALFLASLQSSITRCRCYAPEYVCGFNSKKPMSNSLVKCQLGLYFLCPIVISIEGNLFNSKVRGKNSRNIVMEDGWENSIGHIE